MSAADEHIAAVVLAAGTSSRMGTSKPLLPLGPGPAIGRIVRSISRAGVDDIVVVTGHLAEEVTPVIDELGVGRVHNSAYETGMFSSVVRGIAVLPDDVDAFFVLPADCALVRPHVFALLMRGYRHTTSGILYPTCCGRRGHPPLISEHYRQALIQAGERADEETNLGSFLLQYQDDAAGVEVEDLTILMDMDTPEQYQRMERFAKILDAARGPQDQADPEAIIHPPATGEQQAAPFPLETTLAPLAPAPVPSEAAPAAPETAPATLSESDCLYLLSLLGAPEDLIRHSQTVAAVGVSLVHALREKVPTLDAELVRSACLLHDIAKGVRKHAVVAQSLLENLGLARLGSVIGSHMVLAPDALGRHIPTEEQLCYLADKLVLEDRIASLSERTTQALERYADNAAAVQSARVRMGAARTIADRVEALLGYPIIRETRIYLVRHAQAETPDGAQRFIGQSDPPLSPVGVSQAHLLAEQLGDVLFEAVYSSDLQRCISTAAIISKDTGPDIQEKRELREIDVGLWEGLTPEEARHQHPADYARRELDVVGYRFPEGESFRDLLCRVAPVFSEIMDSGAGEVLVVAHKGVNRVLLAHLLGLPLEGMFSIAQLYCSVNVIKVVRLPDGSRQVSVESLA